VNQLGKIDNKSLQSIVETTSWRADILVMAFFWEKKTGILEFLRSWVAPSPASCVRSEGLRHSPPLSYARSHQCRTAHSTMTSVVACNFQWKPRFHQVWSRPQNRKTVEDCAWETNDVLDSWWSFKGQLGVLLTVYPGIYCVLLGFLGIITHKCHYDYIQLIKGYAIGVRW